MNKLNAYLNLIRFYNPIGFWLLLWPGMWGLFTSENFEIKHFAIVLLGTFLTRSLGCAINDYFDIGFDSQVKRTKDRPLANKTLTKVEALICIIFLGMMCLFILYLTNVFVNLFVLLVAAPLIIVYPLTKRFLPIPQLFLGFTFGLSLPISYAIVEQNISFDVLLMYLACVFWITAYDSLYAMNDIEDDKKISINSLPIFFGQNKYTAIQVFFGVFLAIMFFISTKNSLSILSIGIFFIIYQVYFQIKLSKSGQHFEAFQSNSHIGLVIATLIFLENHHDLLY